MTLINAIGNSGILRTQVKVVNFIEIAFVSYGPSGLLRQIRRVKLEKLESAGCVKLPGVCHATDLRGLWLDGSPRL